MPAAQGNKNHKGVRALVVLNSRNVALNRYKDKHLSLQCRSITEFCIRLKHNYWSAKQM